MPLGVPGLDTSRGSVDERQSQLARSEGNLHPKAARGTGVVVEWYVLGLDTQEAGITAARLDSGWFIIYFRNHPYQVSDEEILAEASSHAELIVSCFVEEHTMYSQAWGFSGGEQLWTLWHDPSEGREHLEVDGTPPECLPAILRANLEKLHAYHRQNSFDVDTVFSVPIEVCVALSGFSYNMIPELIDPCLTLIPTRRKS